VVSRTWKWLAAVTALLGVGLPVVGAIDGNAAGPTSPALCAAGDPNQEPGVQGDVPSGSTPEWDCGVREIGSLPGANGAMAVAGDCAYTGGGADEGAELPGVRVIDVSDPTEPELVRVLDTGSRELLAAQESPDGSRALLATRHRDTVQQEGQVLGRDMLVDVWDIRTCTDPVLLGTVVFPTQSKVFGDPPAETGGPAHNLKFNPSATKLYGSLPLHEVDLANLDDPATWTIRNLHCSITDQYHLPHKTVPGLCEGAGQVDHPFGAVANTPQTDHEPTFSPDGSRLYIGGQLPQPDSNALWVLDMTGPDPLVLSVTDQAPGHSIDFLTVEDADGEPHEYLLHSNEIGGTACIPEQVRPKWVGMGDRAWLLDIGDETAPVKTSEIILADSTFERCGADGNVGGPSTAYHDVDDPLDSSYVVIGFGSAGFRFFDIRDPAEPIEVAYFNWGSSEHTKAYVVPHTGHIWVSDADGFRVLELEPQVIHALGLAPPSREACADDGWRAYKGEDDRPFENLGDCVSYVSARAD
jgi:hypothetical protein